MSYYSDKLGGIRLRECYETAPSRVKQYLDAEICFVIDRLNQGSAILELGCGYGRVFLSSYAEQFWSHRLEWFQLQAKLGLVGEIDLSSTGEGVIVCKDGFRAGAMEPDRLQRSMCTA